MHHRNERYYLNVWAYTSKKGSHFSRLLQPLGPVLPAYEHQPALAVAHTKFARLALCRRSLDYRSASQLFVGTNVTSVVTRS